MLKNTTESMGLKEKDYKLSFVLRNHQEQTTQGLRNPRTIAKL